ncbi:MAG TPA: GtrA family protein [Methylocella sp.]|nr:GtrA family protein [Methylocella sp.]
MRFLALGGCAAAVNWLSRFPLETVMPFSVAVIAAYMVGMVVAFTLFRRFVFPASPQPLEQQVKFFVLVNLAGIAQVWAVSMTLVYYLFPAVGFIGPLSEPIGHGLAIGVPTISSYFGHRFFTFRPS